MLFSDDSIQNSVKILLFGTLASIESPDEGGSPTVGLIQNIPNLKCLKIFSLKCNFKCFSEFCWSLRIFVRFFSQWITQMIKHTIWKCFIQNQTSSRLCQTRFYWVWHRFKQRCPSTFEFFISPNLFFLYKPLKVFGRCLGRFPTLPPLFLRSVL